MKALVILILGMSLYLAANAQTTTNFIQLSETKTSHLVFPEQVDYVQAGDYSLVQAEVVPELSNLVRMKATQAFEKPVSLTVVCAGRIYAFELGYGNEAPIIYQAESFHAEDAQTFSGKLLPDGVLRDLCDQVLDKHRKNYRNRKVQREGIRLRLNSVHLHDDVLFLELEIRNRTPMAYDVESVHFWITDKRQVKATNVQEYLITPDYTRNKISRIPGYTTVREVFVFEKMTIPNQRILLVELNENALGNTGRKLSLELKNKDILQARKL